MNQQDPTVTLSRATEFCAAWNSRDPQLVVSFFTEDGIFHEHAGPGRPVQTFKGREEIFKFVKSFFDNNPGGRFENISVDLGGHSGLLKWDYVTTRADGKVTRTAGIDFLMFRGDLVAGLDRGVRLSEQ